MTGLGCRGERARQGYNRFLALHPQGLANTLMGLAALRVQLPGRAVELLLRGALGARKLAEAAPSPGPGPGLVKPEASAGPAGATSSEGDTGNGGRPGGQNQRSRERQLQSRAGPGVAPCELAAVALALARCGHVPAGRWARRFLAAAAREMGRFGARWVGGRPGPAHRLHVHGVEEAHTRMLMALVSGSFRPALHAFARAAEAICLTPA